MMQGYNNLQTRPQPQRVNAVAPMNDMYGNGMAMNAPNGYQNYPQQPVDDRVFVTGRVGADAYPMPQGVFKVVLWDTSDKRFYVKGYDNNGILRVLGDFDYDDHVEPEPVSAANIDLTPYATKDDIKAMIGDAFRNIQMPNLAGYVTQADFNKALSELSVGNGGRIVRNNESNA